MRKKTIEKQKPCPDFCLLGLSVLLAVLGLVILYSATRSTQSIRRPIVQTLAIMIGIFGMGVLYFVDYRIYRCYKPHLYIGSLLVLVLVFLFGSGKAETGANSWIRFFGIGIQPSELVKIAFVLFFAEQFSKEKAKKTLQNGKTVLKLFALYIGITVLVVLQNDTGTALVFTFMFAVMYFVAGLSYRYVLWAILSICLLLPAFWFCLAPYQKNRILVFFNPELDPTGAGYQVLQSKIAIGSGRLFGRGYQSGPQTQLALLPEKETDFIFSVIGEEFGFLGCVFVVILLFWFIYRILHIATRAKDEAGRLIATGLGSMFLLHVIENVSMCLGLLPVTGIPLPFISYGGSSMVTSFLAVGILLNISKTSKALSFHK